MDNNNFVRAMLAALFVFVLVFGSLLMSAWSEANPIVIDDEIGIVAFIKGLTNPPDESGSTW